MRRYVVPLSFLILISFGDIHPSAAQQGEWTWMKGDSVNNYAGHYGTKGTADPANAPPARYSPTRWKDQEGNFWVYGGFNTNGFLGDLWKYDVATNEWTWISGITSANLTAIYGVQGVPSLNNFPGCRGWGGASWVDAAGDLWLFGGKGYGNIPGPRMLSDLWRYHIASNEWTWMKGGANDSVLYGAKQVPGATNTPGMRMEIAANWTDSTGFWFYGGLSNNMLKSDRNDMWRYDVMLNEWTWMSGDTIVNVYPDLGTQYVFSPTNTPGGRMNHCAWTASNGRFWFFSGHSDLYGGFWADLWQYDPAINQWAFMSGSIDNTLGNAGSVCDTSLDFFPQGRWEDRVTWIDECDNLWLFGGQRGSNSLNDLWVYSPAKKIWSFTSGTLGMNDEGLYGTKGISDPMNRPPSRMGAGGWKDNDGNLWLFGGAPNPSQVDFLGDLWKYVPDPTCPSGINCANSAEIKQVTLVHSVTVFPNPGTGLFWIEWHSELKGNDSSSPSLKESSLLELSPANYSVTVVNAIGQIIFYREEKFSSTQWKMEIDLRRNGGSDISTGVYFLEIRGVNDSADSFGETGISIRSKIMVTN